MRNWQHGARIGGPDADWERYAEAFRLAGDRLVQDYLNPPPTPSNLPDDFFDRVTELQNHPVLDHLRVGYPVLYLYRHSLELWIKAVFALASQVVDENQPPQVTHKLGRAWRPTRDLLSRIFDDEDTATASAFVEEVVVKFDSLDADSIALRYPYRAEEKKRKDSKGQSQGNDKAQKLTLPEVRLEDLINWRDSVRQACSYLLGFATELENLLEQRREAVAWGFGVD
ncbi:MAG: hypothetical protein ACKVVT_09610 [Dehalococcoidia bacterium]